METLAIVGGLTGAGYYLNNNGTRVRDVMGENLIKKKELPVRENIYQQNLTQFANSID